MGSGGFDATHGGFRAVNAQKSPILERIIATVFTGQAQAAIKNIAHVTSAGVILPAPGR
jgi:hypothetical protein